MIAHRNPAGVTVLFHRNQHFSASGREFDRIGKQVGDDLGQSIGIGVDLGLDRTGVEPQLHAEFLGECAIVLDRLLGDLPQSDPARY